MQRGVEAWSLTADLWSLVSLSLQLTDRCNIRACCRFCVLLPIFQFSHQLNHAYAYHRSPYHTYIYTYIRYRYACNSYSRERNECPRLIVHITNTGQLHENVHAWNMIVLNVDRCHQTWGMSFLKTSFLGVDLMRVSNHHVSPWLDSLIFTSIFTTNHWNIYYNYRLQLELQEVPCEITVDSQILRTSFTTQKTKSKSEKQRKQRITHVKTSLKTSDE